MDMASNETTESRDGAYMNMIAIVQSSGTGKSRLVHELAKKIFTIPLNLRNPKHGKYSISVSMHLC
jgi:hypothetical protein